LNDDGKSLRSHIENGIDLVHIVRGAYRQDAVLSKVLKAPKEHVRFGVRDGLIWTKNLYRCDVICIPRSVFLKGRRVIEIIIDHAHQVVGHFGQLKTSNYIRRAYWWPGMATDVDSFCTSCAKCQMSKDSTKKLIGLLHSLPVPEWPWQSIGMDFMGPSPKSDTHDYLLVVIDRLTSQVHLIPTDTRVMAKGVAWLFLREVVCLHGVPDSIVSD
jgi:Integrase zinc binding domain